MMHQELSRSRPLMRWALASTIICIGCVDLTAPWEKARRDAGQDATGGVGAQTQPDGLAAGGGPGGALDAPSSDAGKGGSGGGIDGNAAGAGGSDGAPDVPLGGAGGTGGSLDVALTEAAPPPADAADVAIVGTGGTGGIDASTDAGTGGYAGAGGASAKGGSGGASTATGGTTGKGGAGGTTAKGGAGGTGTGGTTATGTGGAGTGGAGTGGTGTGGTSGCAAPGTGTNALVAYYACEQTSGPALTDTSGNAKDGTITADGTPPDGGVSYAFATRKTGNNALYFTAASKAYAKLPSGLLLHACEATIAAWVYLNSQANWQRIFDFGKPETTPKMYMFLTSKTSTGSKMMRFAISINGNTNNAEQTIDSTSGELPVGAWHHVAVVLGPSGGFLYLDGAQVGANTTMTLRPADLGDIADYFIGKSHFLNVSPPDPYLDGAVDELRIYNHALSATEIQALATP